jgi:hypothetical protein
MQKPWLKTFILVVILISIFFLGNKNVAWASSDGSPVGQTVPTRVRSKTATPNPPEPQPSAPTATYSQLVVTKKSSPTLTSSPTATQLPPTITAPRPTVTYTLSMPTNTVTSPTAILSPTPLPSNRKNISVPVIGGTVLLVIGVAIFIIWRLRANK